MSEQRESNIREFKLVPISKAGFVGRAISPKAAAKRDEEAFLALWDKMVRVHEKVRTKQLDMFADG